MGKNLKGEFSMNKRLAIVFALFVVLAVSLTGCASQQALTVASGPCPVTAVKAAAPTPTVAPVAVSDKKEIIYFDFDKSNIMASEQPKIDKIAGWMKDPKANALVIGYTDPIGTDKYNMGLSEKRARSVKAALVKAGVPENKIKLEARGETNLVKVGAKGIKDNAPNRRAEVLVTVK